MFIPTVILYRVLAYFNYYLNIALNIYFIKSIYLKLTFFSLLKAYKTFKFYFKYIVLALSNLEFCHHAFKSELSLNYWVYIKNYLCNLWSCRIQLHTCFPFSKSLIVVKINSINIRYFLLLLQINFSMCDWALSIKFCIYCWMIVFIKKFWIKTVTKFNFILHKIFINYFLHFTLLKQILINKPFKFKMNRELKIWSFFIQK